MKILQDSFQGFATVSRSNNDIRISFELSKYNIFFIFYSAPKLGYLKENLHFESYALYSSTLNIQTQNTIQSSIPQYDLINAGVLDSNEIYAFNVIDGNIFMPNLADVDAYDTTFIFYAVPK